MHHRTENHGLRSKESKIGRILKRKRNVATDRHSPHWVSVPRDWKEGDYREVWGVVCSRTTVFSQKAVFTIVWAGKAIEGRDDLHFFAYSIPVNYQEKHYPISQIPGHFSKKLARGPKYASFEALYQVPDNQKEPRFTNFRTFLYWSKTTENCSILPHFSL